MPRFDFECREHHQFCLWDTEPRACPVCGSEFLKKVFLEPPMINTKKSAVVDNMVRNQLESMGITNIQGGGHEGDREKITYKTTPEQLAAQKIEKDFPQMNDKDGLAKVTEQVVTRWSNVGVKGVINSRLPGNPVLQGAIPKGTIEQNGKVIAAPSGEPNQFRVNDSRMVRRQHRKDPENLQVKKA